MNILTIVLVGNSILLLGSLFYVIRAFNRERRELLTAIIAKSLPEYAAGMDKLKTSPKDKLKQIKAENDLALANEKLIQQAGEKGIAIT